MMHPPDRPPAGNSWPPSLDPDDLPNEEGRVPTPPEHWLEKRRQAAARLDPTVAGALAEAAGRAWGSGRGREWEVLLEPDLPTWRLARLLGGASDGWEYQELRVVATVAPDGEVVALQVSNGADFLALADTSREGLLRGLLHLLGKPIPTQHAKRPPFSPKRGGLLGRLLGR